MKKAAVAFALGLIAAGCSSDKYQSSLEAEDACDIWEAGGVTYIKRLTYTSYDGPMPPPKNRTYTHNARSRRCELDELTRQYIGYETGDGIQKGARVNAWEVSDKVIKRFKF